MRTALWAASVIVASSLVCFADPITVACSESTANGQASISGTIDTNSVFFSGSATAALTNMGYAYWGAWGSMTLDTTGPVR